ncbi:oligosaccharide flippase family protein [Bacillus pseudomycoides]|uniref:oligosaccharide flippase family protein n=1 Tax=Bacillus pseudomycoides TaxID=64104 RepID=UPI001FB1B189|nr:oligosaccharide flippase family protein [Bacillus pseudomycoides]
MKHVSDVMIKMRLDISALWKKVIDVGFFHLLSANLFIQLAGFSGQIFLTRWLTVEEIGRLKVLQSFTAIFVLLATVGMNTAILQKCAEQPTVELKNLYLLTGIKISLYSSVFVTIVVFVLADMQLISNNPAINQAMKTYCLIVPSMVINGVLVVYWQALKKVKLLSRVQISSRLIVLIIGMVSAFFFHFQGYIISLVLANFVIVLLCLYLIRNDLKNFFHVKMEWIYMKGFLRLGIFACLTNLLGQLLSTINIIMVSYMTAAKSEIGYYSVAQLIVSALMMIPQSFNGIMIPYISEKSKDIKSVGEIVKKYQKRMLLLMTIITMIVGCILPIVIPFVFGEVYRASIKYFYFLLAGLYFWSLYSPKGITMMSIGRVEGNFYTGIVAVVVNVLLNYIFIKEYGVLGAAIANSITYFVTIFVNHFFYQMIIRKAARSMNYE